MLMIQLLDYNDESAVFIYFYFLNTHVMSDMDKDIDFDIIESYKKPITILLSVQFHHVIPV
ncbi:hypothetical protein BSPWISOXPB_8816 [uncultured Gammaproteobacteria bacterium]|nr:hypothetical protein BSPWISOXPB_8816 [uncultured Gammaproteobacteria bacterium]